MSYQTLTVLFADLADSTRLYQTRGDEEAYSRVTDSLQCMTSVVENHSGKLLKTVGDAVMASFDSADAAYLAAVDIQRKHTELSLSVRVGFHHGEVIPDAGDVFGNTVNLAARVASFAEPNEIYTTEDTVAQLCETHRSTTQCLDHINFKGVSEPMAVYRIHWAVGGGETTIVSAITRSGNQTRNLVLELLIGDSQIRLDEHNTAVRFGRGSDNDVLVDAESVSRNHAKIELVRGRFLLFDSSTNGTYLLAERVLPQFVRRESTVLDNFGSIGLGCSPESNSPHTIQFKVTFTS